MATRTEKRLQKRLQQLKRMTSKQTAAAMNAASEALDKLQQENQALRRILISERAQVIYYTSKYEAFVAHTCIDLKAVGFLDLPEAIQESYVKKAVRELSGDVEPHAGGESESGPKLIVN